MRKDLKTRTTASSRLQGIFREWEYPVTFLLILALFFPIYGVSLLNPLYTDWIMGRTDLTQHYLGWLSYRNSRWFWPLGLTDRLSWPYPVSVMFTDSIPLLAVPCKLLRGILPEDFQYFGLWGLACYLLSGCFALRILRRFIPSRAYCVFMSLILVFTPTALQRTYMHSALGAVWLLFAAMDLYFSAPGLSHRQGILRWSLLGVLCAAVHPYLLLMCGILLSGSCLEILLRRKKLTPAHLSLPGFVGSAALTVWILGGFSGGFENGGDGLGVFSWNLNALLNPMSCSAFLPSLPITGTGQYEGFTYLGAGGILMLLLSLVGFAVSGPLREKVRRRKSALAGLIFVLAVSLPLAVSPSVSFGDRVLFTLPCPEILRNVLGTFRAGGRIGWIFLFLALFASMIALWHFLGPRMALVLAPLLVLLQGVDIAKIPLEKHEWYYGRSDAQLQSPGEAWDAALRSEPEAVILTAPYTELDPDIAQVIVCGCLKKGIALNDFYFARPRSPETGDTYLSAVRSPREGVLYLFFPENAPEVFRNDLCLYEANGFFIGSTEPVPGLTTAEPGPEWTVRSYRFGDGLVRGGTEEAGRRILYPGGLSFGPYDALPAGEYLIRAEGENLAGCSFSVGMQGGRRLLEAAEITADEDAWGDEMHPAAEDTEDPAPPPKEARVFRVTIPEGADDVEVSVRNEGDSDAVLTLIAFRIFP